MARPAVAWSYSALSSFENCPRKYWATKIAKVVSDINRANTQGDDDHQSIEHFMKSGMPLVTHLKQAQPLFDKIKAAPGEAYVEYSMTLTEQMVPCRWNDWDNAWVRGAGDYVKINGSVATYFDWKSGKPRSDVEDQVDLTSLLLFRHFPQVQVVRGGMVYYNHGKMTPHTVNRTDESRLWNGFISRVEVLKSAKREDNWPATPNPLCGWCPYMACPHNKVEERLAREAAAKR